MSYNITFKLNPTTAATYVRAAVENPSTIEANQTVTLKFFADGSYYTLQKDVSKALSVTGATISSWTTANPFKEGTLVLSNATTDVVVTLNPKASITPQTVLVPFKLNKTVPIDTRLMLSKYEMTTMNDKYMPDCYFAICKEDKKMYVYDKEATANAETGKFSLLETYLFESEEAYQAVQAAVLSDETVAALTENLATKININGGEII